MRGKAALLALLALVLGCGALVAEVPAGPAPKVGPVPWENPGINEIDRLPMHTSFFAFESEAAAAQGDRTRSHRFLSLNGEWSFNYSRNPGERPAGFQDPAYDVSTWPRLAVPGNWELQGYGIAHYVNIEYVFPANQPFLPDDYNPVGSYRRDFTVPADWSGQQVILHFGAVTSAFYVWVNGKLAGYSEDSKLPAEFDVTRLLKPGTNQVAVEIYRFSDGSYLEDQDMWSLSGMTRDVFLFARPQAHIENVIVQGGLTPDMATGTLAAEVDLAAATARGRGNVELRLLDGQRELLRQQRPVHGNGQLSFSAQLPDVAPWSAETPRLYTLEIVLRGAKGEVLEAVRQQVGFRDVRVVGGRLMVNGKAVTIRGVNRHEHDPTTGHYVSRELMEQDVRLMKAFNINALRMSHYPNDPYMYELADRYGLYVMDEANIESHEYMRMGDQAKPPHSKADYQLGYKPEWELAHRQRVLRMVERDRNHPSIIMWSLGNEAGTGPAFAKAYAAARQMDPSRPVVYGGFGDESTINVLPYSDLYTPMYDTVADMLTYVRSDYQKSMIEAEYAHSMGNSLGNFKEYWDTIYANPKLQGGFVWDFVDQTLYKKDAEGRTFFAYGADFGPSPRPDSDNFLANGLFQPDRTPNPHVWELKKVYQPVAFALAAGGTLAITNHYDFLDLSHLQFRWRLEADGREVAAGELADPAIPAGSSGALALPAAALAPQTGKETFLTVEAVARDDFTPLVDPGTVIAWEQFPIGQAPAAVPVAPGAAPQASEQGGKLVVTAGSTSRVVFDMASGELAQWTDHGRDLLVKGLTPNLWRAPTDNDSGGGWMVRMCSIWKRGVAERKLAGFSYRPVAGGLLVATTYELGEGAGTFAIDYLLLGDGSLEVTGHLVPGKDGLPIIPRVGMNVQLKGNYSALEWFGRGPQENYWDRKTGAAVGDYRSTVPEQYHDYSRPQETGNKADVRWFVLSNADGSGVEFSGEGLLNFSALPVLQSDLDHERNRKEPRPHGGLVPFRDLVSVNVDHLLMGVGGDNSWGAMPLKKYQIPAREYRWRFRMAPFAEGDDAYAIARRAFREGK